MTILLQAARASQLVNIDRQNHPFMLFDNLATNYSAPDGTQTGGPIANLASEATRKFVRPTQNADGNYYIRFDTTMPVSAVGIAAHNFSEVSADVTLQYSTNGGASWINVATAHEPSDSQAIVWRFLLAATTFRLAIGGSPTGQPVLAILFAGNEIIVPQRIHGGYAPPLRSNRVATENNVSEGGEYLGSAVVRSGATAEAPFTLLKPSFTRGAQFSAMVDHYNAARPFFWAWRPATHGDVDYAWRPQGSGPMQPVNSSPPGFQDLNFTMRFYRDT